MRLRGNPQPTLSLLRQETCQGKDNFLPVPQGCRIAPDTAESRFVVGNYNWNTRIVTLDSGKPICTKLYAKRYSFACEDGAGGICGPGCPASLGSALKSSNNRHAVGYCHTQILYQCPGSCCRPHLSFFLSLFHTISLVKSHLKRHNTQTHFQRDCALNNTNNTNNNTYVSLVSGKPKPTTTTITATTTTTGTCL